VPEPIIKPPPKIQYDIERLKPMLGKNVQILLDSPRPYLLTWVIGEVVAVENSAVTILTYKPQPVEVPMSTIAAVIRLTDY